MQLGDILLGDLDPSGALHVIDAHHATGHGITMRGVIDGAASQLVRFRVVELPFVLAVEHAVRVRRTAAHREDVVGHASAVVTDIVQARSLKSKVCKSNSRISWLKYLNLLVCPSRQSWYPWRGPYPCRSRSCWLESWRHRPPRFSPCCVARRYGNSWRALAPKIDNRPHRQPWYPTSTD